MPNPPSLTQALMSKDERESALIRSIYVNKAGPERPQGFHTGWKDSGLGGDDGVHGYERYVRRKTAYVGYGAEYGE